MRVLLIEDNPDDVLFVQEELAQAGRGDWAVESASLLSAGLTRLARGGVDVLLTDLGLPDSQGLDTLRRVREQAPELPIVVLTGTGDDALGLQAVSEGAQDYLYKGEVQGRALLRTIRFAMQRRSRSSDNNLTAAPVAHNPLLRQRPRVSFRRPVVAIPLLPNGGPDWKNRFAGHT